WTRPLSQVVAVNEIAGSTPTEFRLEQNYPNPFNPSTTISYQLSTSTLVSLKVFDILGREITTLVNEVNTPGRYSVTWNAVNFSSGVYFCRFAAGGHTEIRTMVLIK
ncbi:MAG: T9SS type A sorting domain-containing protein, partial [Bacteroidota bacterium]